MGVYQLYEVGRKKVIEKGYTGSKRAANRWQDSIISVDPDKLDVG